MSSRIVFCLLALWCVLVVPVVHAETPEIEVDLEDDGLRIEFSEPMRVLDNVELRDLVTSIPARRYICVWQDDVELNCKIEGGPLPPATPVNIMLADGLQTAAGKRLPVRTIKTETARPSLRASLNSWDGARPQIVIESEHVLSLDAVAAVLRLRSNGREWSNLTLQVRPLASRDWLKSRFALILPDDINAGAEVELRIVPGLRTTEGPLPGNQNAQLLRFVDREPFQVRWVSCEGPSRQVQRTVRKGLLNTFCVPGEPIWLSLSSRLDAAGRNALAAMLPKALTLQGQADTPWWPGMRVNDNIVRRPGAGVQLRFDASLASETFDLGAALRDDQGRALTPVRLRIATSEARPQLQASARALLLGDPSRDPIRSVNAEPVDLRVAALAGGFTTQTVTSPDSRGGAAGVNTDASARALAAGGWAQWRPGEREAAMHVAAPQFELSAYATRRELVAWATEWKGGAAIADAEVELLLHIDGEPPKRIVAGRSDRDGLLRLRLPDAFRMPAQQGGVPSPQWLLRAQAGARRAVLPLGAGPGYGLNLGVHRIDGRLWGVADRPLYRAGDTVRYSLWLRERNGGRLQRMPETAPVGLSLYFSDEDKTLRTWTAKPDDMGGIVGEERLPQHLVDGNYCIRMNGGARQYSDVCFFVGTYRSQDLWAEASAEDRVLRSGDTFAAEIAAGYYSGGGAADVALSRVSTMLTGLPLSSAYPAYADYNFIDVNSGVGREGVSLLGESRDWGKLDRDGKKRIELPLAFKLGEDDTDADLPAFGRLQLTAEVMLEAREGTVSNAAQARYARYARYVGLRIAPRWFDATTPLRLDGVVIDAEGHAQAGAAIEVAVEYLPGFGDDSDKDAKREAVARCSLVAGTTSTCDFPRKRSGRYLLTARSGDAAPVEIERYVWTGGDGANAQRLALEIVEAPARPDAPARLLLKSPYARAHALIVIESEGALLDSRVIAIDGAAHELLLPLRAEGRGQVNVYALVRERTDAGIDANGLRLPAKSDATSVTAAVPRRDRAPQLALTLDKERTAPAQVLRIRLHNAGSTPRTATLAVLDDAVRALGAQWWSDFDPRSERWLGMRADDWSSRPFLAGFRDWNKTPWQRRLQWTNARQPAEEIVRPDMAVDAASEEPSPVVFDEPSPTGGLQGVPAPPPPPPPAEQANTRARMSVSDHYAAVGEEQDSFGRSGDELDSIEVTGSRISAVDVFTAGEGPSPVLAIDRAQIAEGLQSSGDLLPGIDKTRVQDGRGRSDTPPRDHSRDALRVADAKALFGARLRKDFADTALWQPGIRLAPGETRVIEFTVPDNLTRWRAVAWSSDADDGFEMAEATFEVGLPLEVRLQTPVRVYPGDRADLVANVRQSGDRAVDVDATLQVETLGVDATRTLALAPRGQTTLPLRIAPLDADLREETDGASRTLTAVAAARSGDDRDAVSASIELASPTIDARKVQAGWLGATPLRLDAPMLPRSASDIALRVSLLPGADALVHQWIDDLHAYPHRCWEQILSRGVAAAIAIERGDGDRWPDAKAAVQEVVENIAVFQGQNGAFRYFADGEDPGRYDESKAQHALTAYSVRALRLLTAMGHAVPGEALGRGEGFLQRRSRPSGDDSARIDETAFVAAAQTRPGRDVLDVLWRRWAALGLPARVATTRAMLAGQHPAAAEAVAKLRDATRRRGEASTLRSEVRHDRWMSSDLREHCEFIGLLFDFPDAGDAALRRSLIAGLGDLYAGGFAAVDTQTGASCLISLRALSKRKPEDTVALDIAHGEERGALRLEPDQPAQQWQRALNSSTAKAPLQLTPHIQGDASASYIAEIRYREDAREASSTAVGFALARRYEVLRERGWVATGKETLRDGDWLRITLSLDTGADRYFVAITDAVPGGLRPTDLALSGVAGLDLQKVSDEGSHWFRTRRLDPRAPKFYAEFLPAGRHELHYFARVGNTGDYLAAPAVAELMYGESTRARTAATRVAIEATGPASAEKRAE